jgi:hypothetical protein
VALWPVPPSTRIAAPDVGQLPITRGGRVLEVEFSVPGRTEDQLRTEPFQACISPRPPPPRSTAMDNVTPKNASVRLVDVRDGSVTLAVTMPDAVDTLFSIYQPSLIGAGGSSCSSFLPRPWVTRFSPRSAPWPPHHGVRRVGVPIC